MGNETKLRTFTFASDYNPAHYKWTEKELSSLGDCSATAEVIKKRLEDNGAKVKEMYAIEHKGEKEADSKSEEFHGPTDETKLHYHILVKFEYKQGVTLKKIAKYIGVRPEHVRKLRRGGYSYPNVLAYMTHIKYEKKIQYAPEDVVTLAGTDYMECYNENKESWLKGRDFVTKNGGKSLDRLFREAMAKLDREEIAYNELRGIKEYRKLLKNPVYAKKLKDKGRCMADLAKQDCSALCDKIQNREITSLDEIMANEEWKLACMYQKRDIERTLRETNYVILCEKIKNGEIISLDEILANKDWKSAYEQNHYEIQRLLREYVHK